MNMNNINMLENEHDEYEYKNQHDEYEGMNMMHKNIIKLNEHDEDNEA